MFSEGLKKLDDEKEDNGIVDPRCISKYNNQNCSQAQKDQGIAEYRNIRLQQLQLIMQNTSNSNASQEVPTKAPETPKKPEVKQSTSGSVAPAKPANGPAATSGAQNSFNASSVSLFKPSTGSPACDRAFRLLGVADLFARYNASCQARIFGISSNPDFWIRRCEESKA